MKKLFAISLLCFALASCSDNQPSQNSYNSQPDNSNTQVNVTVQQKPVGLDLQSLGELAKKSKSAKQLEDSLNQPGGINNVDLNGDGNVDYLDVAEFSNGDSKGFSVVDYTPNTSGGVDTNEIANITIAKNQSNPQAATVNINGNTNIYGNNNSSYQTDALLTDLIIYNYLFSYHPYYYSPYRYGYYPSYYHPYRPIAYGAYSNRVSTYRTTTTYRTVKTPSTSKSPYAGKTSKSVASSYKPSPRTDYSSQKSSSKDFAVRDNSKPVNNSGFKNTKSSSGGGTSHSSGSAFHSSSGSSHSSGGFHSSGGRRH